MQVCLGMFELYSAGHRPSRTEFGQPWLKSSHCICVTCNKSALRWYWEIRHNKVLMLFFWHYHFISKNTLVCYKISKSCVEHATWWLIYYFCSCNLALFVVWFMSVSLLGHTPGFPYGVYIPKVHLIICISRLHAKSMQGCKSMRIRTERRKWHKLCDFSWPQSRFPPKWKIMQTNQRKTSHEYYRAIKRYLRKYLDIDKYRLKCIYFDKMEDIDCTAC